MIGAGASGLALTDTLVSDADVDVDIVDRNDASIGHWVHAYPFVDEVRTWTRSESSSAPAALT